MAVKTPLPIEELMKKTQDIAAAKRKANTGKPGVIPTVTTSGLLGDPSSFKTISKTGVVTDATADEVNRITNTVKNNPVSNTETDLKTQIADTQKQNTINRFKTAFEQSKGRLAQEESAVTPRFRQQESLIGTQDVMARTGAEKSRETGGLGQAGAIGQSEMAQNVITQGALGASREQEQNIRADIERRLSEAQMLRDQGIATAESEADLMIMQNKLAELERIEADKKASDAKAESDFLMTIGRFSNDFQAEINRNKNDGDLTNDWQIPILEAARQDKIATQGLDQQGQPIEQGVSYTIPQALEASRQGYWSKEIADALGVPFTEQGRAQVSGGTSGGGTSGAVEEPTETGMASDLVKEQNMRGHLNSLGTTYNPNTMKTEQTPLSAIDKIKDIEANYATYVKQYGEANVTRITTELAYEAGLPGFEQPQAEIADLSGSEAQKLWEQVGVANEAISKALGVEIGAEFRKEEVIDTDALSTERLDAAFQEMMASADPNAWLEEERQFMTLEEYNELKKAIDYTEY